MEPLSYQVVGMSQTEQMSQTESLSYQTETTLSNKISVIADRAIVTNRIIVISCRLLKETKSNHPWMTEEIANLVAAKKAAEGTDQETLVAEKCSSIIAKTGETYISDTKKNLLT